jgi:hypothetical protein
MCHAIEQLERRVLMAAMPAPLAGLTLINADTDQRADLSAGAVGSVRFNFDGNPNYKIENFAPYDIGGDARGGRDFLPWLPTVGMHTLIVTSYSGQGATGQPGQPYITLFNVIDTSAPAPPLRINAGGASYTDSSGEVFSADAFFHGGRQQFDNVPIAGTSDPALYQSRRQGHEFSFSRNVPDDTYAVTLYFADPGLTRGNNVNIFDVFSDAATLLDHYNIVADAGPRVAVQKTFIVPVTDGRIDLRFEAERGEAMVSGIAIVPQRVPLVESPLYVNAGGLSLTDSIGRTFEPGIGFTGGTTSQAAFPVNGTADVSLFSAYRSGRHFRFSQPVANGDYELWLEFAEPTATLPGQRIFDVSANDQSLLDHYDIVADAGPEDAVAKAFDVRVTGGALNLSFDGIAGDAIVSSIVLIPKDIPTAAAPYAIQNQSATAITYAAAFDFHALGEAILESANAARGRFPQNLASLVPAVIDPEFLASPRTDTLLPRGELSVAEKVAWAKTLDDYVYLGAGKVMSHINGLTPIAYTNPDRVAGDIDVLLASGFIERLDRADASALLGIVIGQPTHAPAPPTIPPPPADAKILISQLHLQAIALAALNYGNAQTRGGTALPPDMGTLVAFSRINLENLVNPRGSSPAPPVDLNTDAQLMAWANAATDYTYAGAGKRVVTRAEFPLAYENPAAMAAGIDMVFLDAHVEFREMRWAVETILRDRAAFGAGSSAGAMGPLL